MLTITDSREISETIDGDVLLKDSANVRMNGIVNGDVHAFHGTKLSLFGQVNGSIVTTDATVNLNPGAKIAQGFSWNGDFGGGPVVRAGHDIRADDAHLKSAVKKHCQMLKADPGNHA